jgi:hypothetical protein
MIGNDIVTVVKVCKGSTNPVINLKPVYIDIQSRDCIFRYLAKMQNNLIFS